MTILALHDVSKSFGATPVLSGVSLEIQPGEVVGIVGFSGAGKSTLIALLAGLVLPDTGQVTFRGQEVRAPGPERGVVFQNYSLLPWLTAYENIALGVGQAFPNDDAKQRHERVERYLALVGLGAAGGKRPGQLSGGMRQRVSVARALAMDPEVLLLDEPLAGMGPEESLRMVELIEALARDHTVILIDHDNSIDDYHFDAFGVPVRIVESGAVSYRLGVEENEIGGIALCNDAAVHETECSGRSAGHLVNGLWECDKIELSSIMSKNPRKRSVESRVRFALPCYAIWCDARTIRADRHKRVRQNLPDVCL